VPGYATVLLLTHDVFARLTDELSDWRSSEWSSLNYLERRVGDSMQALVKWPATRDQQLLVLERLRQWEIATTIFATFGKRPSTIRPNEILAAEVLREYRPQGKRGYEHGEVHKPRMTESLLLDERVRRPWHDSDKQVIQQSRLGTGTVMIGAVTDNDDFWPWATEHHSGDAAALVCPRELLDLQPAAVLVAAAQSDPLQQQIAAQALAKLVIGMITRDDALPMRPSASPGELRDVEPPKRGRPLMIGVGALLLVTAGGLFVASGLIGQDTATLDEPITASQTETSGAAEPPEESPKSTKKPSQPSKSPGVGAEGLATSELAAAPDNTVKVTVRLSDEMVTAGILVKIGSEYYRFDKTNYTKPIAVPPGTHKVSYRLETNAHGTSAGEVTIPSRNGVVLSLTSGKATLEGGIVFR
jgi:hypothetical protein